MQLIGPILDNGLVPQYVLPTGEICCYNNGRACKRCGNKNCTFLAGYSTYQTGKTNAQMFFRSQWVFEGKPFTAKMYQSMLARSSVVTPVPKLQSGDDLLGDK
jgi:hypothetical protein